MKAKKAKIEQLRDEIDALTQQIDLIDRRMVKERRSFGDVLGQELSRLSIQRDRLETRLVKLLVSREPYSWELFQ